MPMSHYPNGFQHGVSIRGMPILNTHVGNVYWVSSVSGSNGNKGTRERPFATIDYAIGRCTANNGDIIFVMPKYAQTLTATDITVDVAGISIVGIGVGDNMPRLNHNHANAEVSITADDVVWQGIRHSADVTGVLVGIEIEDGATGVTVRGCKFDVVTTGTDEFNVTIRTNDASNGALIEDNDIDMGLGGAVAAISFTKDTDSTVVRGNRVWGDYSTACINGITTLSTNLLIEGNLLVNGTGGNIGTEPGIELVTGTTGIIRNNDIVCNLTTVAASVVADTCFLFENYYNEDAGGAGTGGIIGTASAND